MQNIQDRGTAGSARSYPSQGLPSIVVLEIFQWLDWHSLLKCRLVCSGFQSLIDSTASLQYQIELAIAGQQDGNYGDMFTRREMLKMHQKRWHRLQWTEVLRVPRISNYWGLSGGVLAQTSENHSALNLLRIPSQSRGIKEENWTLNLSTLFEEETRMGNFGLDPGQDLLVIVARARATAGKGLRIHLLTLSKGERHPLTLEPCLEPHDLSPEWFCIAICHDFLSIHSMDSVVLWNWKTGQILLHVINNHEISSVVFLNERYVLLAIVEDSDAPHLLVVDFLAESSKQRRLHELEKYFIFQLPSIFNLANIDNIIDIIVQSNPRSTWQADTDQSVPFSMVPQNRLFVVYLFSNNIGDDLSFAILEASFLNVIKAGLLVNNNCFEWSTWGPDHSRVLPNCSFSSSWPFPSHGTRLAIKRYLPHHVTFVDIYDFNQLGCRNKKQDSDVETPRNVNLSESSEMIECQPVCVLAPSKTKGNLFHDLEVETRLGYTVTSWSVPGKSYARTISVLCSEDAVIVVDDGTDDEMYEIYTV